MKDLKLRLQELKETLNLYNYQYYVLDANSVTDSEFDRLLYEIKQIA